MRRGRPPYPGLLTPREQEVLDLLRQGLTNRQIGERLGVSVATANYHVSEILSKLGVSSREEAAALQTDQLIPRQGFGLLALIAAPLRALPPSLVGKVAAAGVVSGAGVGLLFLAIGVLAMDDRPTQPGTSSRPDLGRLAYVLDGDIWTRDVPDGKPFRLTTDGLNFQTEWSSSGDWILFSHREGSAQNVEYGTWLISSDGGDPRRLTASPAAWSPTADSLAYLADDGSLVRENADGSQRQPIASPGSLQSLSVPVWSPDGTTIAFTSTSPDATAQDGRVTRLMLAGASSGAPTELLRVQGGFLLIKAWSGDAQSLVVARGEVVSASLQADGLSLWLVPVSTGQHIALDLDVLTYDDFISPQLGGAAVALIEGGGRNAWSNKRLQVRDAASGAVEYASPEGVSASSPSWSRDGAKVAYVAAAEAGREVVGGNPAKAALALRRIWTLDISSGAATQVTSDEAYRDERPLWSRDGDALLFARLDGEGVASVWVLTAASGRAQVVATRLSLGAALPTHQPELWFGYYGHIPWEQFFDWWQPPD